MEESHLYYICTVNSACAVYSSFYCRPDFITAVCLSLIATLNVNNCRHRQRTLEVSPTQRNRRC